MRLQFPGRGDVAPEFVLPAIDGGTVCFAEYARPVALVFLRHLG